MFEFDKMDGFKGYAQALIMVSICNYPNQNQ